MGEVIETAGGVVSAIVTVTDTELLLFTLSTAVALIVCTLPSGNPSLIHTAAYGAVVSTVIGASSIKNVTRLIPLPASVAVAVIVTAPDITLELFVGEVIDTVGLTLSAVPVAVTTTSS